MTRWRTWQALARSRRWYIRFIKKMPLTGNEWGYVSSAEVLRQLDSLGPLVPESRRAQNGPARCYRFSGAEGSIGFISPMSEPFCSTCNRLRLTATGMLRPCLLSDVGSVDLKAALRTGADIATIQALLLGVASCKLRQHPIEGCSPAPATTMSQIGG